MALGVASKYKLFLIGTNLTFCLRRFDATQLRAKVSELTQWPDVPHLDEAFLHQNLKHLAALKMITPP